MDWQARSLPQKVVSNQLISLASREEFGGVSIGTGGLFSQVSNQLISLASREKENPSIQPIMGYQFPIN